MSAQPAPQSPVDRNSLPSLWIAALACFVLAALTGATMRFGMIHGLPFGLEFVNVRHAHSHLMFFSWVTPLLMAMTAGVAWPHGRRRSGYRLGLLALLTGLLSYVPFLLSGYGELTFLGRELPLSMMTAGLTGIAWYLFAILHFWYNRGRPRDLPLRALDGAVVLLLLASLAVTAVPGVAVMGDGNGLILPLIDLFLEAFGEGWFVLALVAIAYGQLRDLELPGSTSLDLERASESGIGFGMVLLTIGLSLRSVANLGLALGIEVAQLPALLGAMSAAAGGFVVLLPLLGKLARLDSAWLVPLLFLLLKSILDPFLSWQGIGRWSDGMGFRILFLHAFLLGSVSLGLLAAVRHRLALVSRLGSRQSLGSLRRLASVQRPGSLRRLGSMRRLGTLQRLDSLRLLGVPLFTAAVLVLLLGLIPLTGLWPVAWSGPWVLHFAAWTSLGPPLAAAFIALIGPVPSRRRAAGGASSRAVGYRGYLGRDQ